MSGNGVYSVMCNSFNLCCQHLLKRSTVDQTTPRYVTSVSHYFTSRWPPRTSSILSLGCSWRRHALPRCVVQRRRPTELDAPRLDAELCRPLLHVNGPRPISQHCTAGPNAWCSTNERRGPAADAARLSVEPSSTSSYWDNHQLGPNLGAQ